ncbi:MAG: hypothetical protein JST16_01535, partial [Bdellovibrionales bacterium]|nr:hypothetical protein [Bdellovibrionales bacterium]
TTYYLNDPISGTMSEKTVSGSTVTWHDYLVADGRMVGERFCTGAAPCSTGATWSFFVSDHLGSIAVVTDSAGTVTERLSYDAWGRRRNSNGTDNTSCNITSGTTRGFTGHEEMDAICRINANARIYDPTIGRFLSADSIVPDPSDSQAFNRYSYVLNAPLSLIDPSGHEIETVVVTGIRPIPTDPPPPPPSGNFGSIDAGLNGSGSNARSVAAFAETVKSLRRSLVRLASPTSNKKSQTANDGSSCADPTGSTGDYPGNDPYGLREIVTATTARSDDYSGGTESSWSEGVDANGVETVVDQITRDTKSNDQHVASSNIQLAFFDPNESGGGRGGNACHQGADSCKRATDLLEKLRQISQGQAVIERQICNNTLNACLEWNRAMQAGELPRIPDITIQFSPLPPYPYTGGTVILTPGNPSGTYIPPSNSQ